tara:strand:+ start:65 stop:703 length:639 start_codon:yes stop_codon:yes gene_type:complete
MSIKKIFFKYKSFKSGITIVETIVVFLIISILISISIPSMRRYIYKNERDNYLIRINSFLELIKRETRRYGISCKLKTVNIDSYPKEDENPFGSITPFQLICSGDNNDLSTLRFKIPKITQRLFQRVSGDLIFTPKGQVFIENLNNNNKLFILAVGMKDSSLGIYDSMKCIKIYQPSGLIINGSYVTKYNTSLSYSVSNYDGTLVDDFCTKD